MQAWTKKLGMATLTMALGFMAANAEPAPPVIPVCGQPPRMDGSLDDPAWGAALAIADFVRIDAGGEHPPMTNVTARLMRDDAWLYVGFDIAHPLPLTVVPVYRHRDEKVQRENCVKVGFDPGTDGKLWYHFRLSCGNVRSEQRNSAQGGMQTAWNIPWRSAVRITDTGWQAEIALPFALLMEMGEPEKARINLLAHIFTPILDPYGVEIGKEREVAAWAATPASWWTTPDRFIAVAGLADAAFEAPFLPRLEKAEISGYEFADGKNQYRVMGLARNYSSRAGKVALRVKDAPVAGEPAMTALELDLAGGADAEFNLAVPVRSVVRRNIEVEIAGAEGEILDRILIENPPVLDLFSAYLDRNYYTTEKQAEVVCRIGLPEAGLEHTSLAVIASDGKILGETKAVKPHTECAFALADIAAGSHQIKVEFRQASGALIADQALELVKRPPKPGREWKIDRKIRMLLDNGQPYFAYGILMGGWNRNVFNDENYREIAEAGFNSIMYWAAPGTVEATLEALDKVGQYNMHMVAIPLAFAGNRAGFQPKLPEGLSGWSGFTYLKGGLMKSKWSRPERNRIHADIFDQAAPVIRAGIEAVKDHPALMAYESFDEPLLDSYFDQYAEGRKLYRLANETDGYHPMRVLWNSGMPPYEEKYTDWSDIHARDPYWAPPVGAGRDSPNWVARETAELTARGRIDRKPVWQTPVLEMYSGHYKRHHLPAEQRAQTYLAILYECSGVFYFVYPAMHQATWDMMKELGREIRAIYPLITTPVPEHKVAYAGLDVDVIGMKMPDVHAALRRNPAGGYALLAVNGRPWPVQASFSLPFVRPSGRIRSQFGPETFAVKDGAFSDTIEPFGRRVYLVDATTDAGPDLTVTVAQTPLNADYVPEQAELRIPETGVKNIMPNPSFEENTLPGFPDYWFLGAHSAPTYPNQRAGRENAIFELDAGQAYHGKYSYRIRGGYTYFKLCPQHDRPTPYVWSAWMRADRPGVTVRFGGDGISKQAATFTPTTEWQRYHVPLTMPRHARRHNSYALSVATADPGACVWVDAMQFELGAEPTEFEP